jgi:hypothetical protein
MADDFYQVDSEGNIAVDFRKIPDLQTLHTVTESAYEHMSRRLEALGIPAEDIGSIVMGFININKTYNGTFVRLMQEGKIRPEELPKPGSGSDEARQL